MEVQGFKVLNSMSDQFTDAVDYHQYWVSKTSTSYDDDVARELRCITKKVALQMKDSTFDRRDPVLIIAFLNDFKDSYDAYKIDKGTAFWILKHFLTGPVKFVIKAQVVLPSKTSQTWKECLTTYAAVVKFLLKR